MDLCRAFFHPAKRGAVLPFACGAIADRLHAKQALEKAYGSCFE
jgi:hypothetical protein